MRVKFIIGALTIVALGVMLMRFYGSTSRDPTEGLEIVASELEIPWGLAFSPDGRLFFTERSGRVNVIQDDRVQTLLTLDVAAKPGQEGGLLGIELDPQFPQNGHVYLYYTYEEKGGRWNRISRFTEVGDTLADETVILDNIPAGDFHNGGRIKFGPDARAPI